VLAISGVAAAAAEFVKPDKAPVPVRTPPPRYPAKLEAEGISGMVVVNIVVDADGEVEDVVVRKSTHSAFEKPAMDAVRKWRFKPARKDGDAIRSKVALPLKFTAK
jgi:protein TonB